MVKYPYRNPNVKNKDLWVGYLTISLRTWSRECPWWKRSQLLLRSACALRWEHRAKPPQHLRPLLRRWGGRMGHAQLLQWGTITNQSILSLHLLLILRLIVFSMTLLKCSLLPCHQGSIWYLFLRATWSKDWQEVRRATAWGGAREASTATRRSSTTGWRGTPTSPGRARRVRCKSLTFLLTQIIMMSSSDKSSANETTSDSDDARQ